MVEGSEEEQCDSSARGDTDFNRRTFMKTAGATTGIFGLTALAGCQGDGDDGGSGSETSESGGEMGEQLPSYTYKNQPPSSAPAEHDAVNLIAEQTRQAGIDVEVEVFEWGKLYSSVREDRDYDFASWLRGLGIDPGRRLPEMFHSSNLQPAGSGNFEGYENPDLDPVLMEQMQVTDTDERVELLHECQEVITRDCPINAVTFMPNLMAYDNTQVSGWVDFLQGYNFYPSMVNIEVDNEDNTLRGALSDSLGTLNPLGFNNEFILLWQFDVIYDKLVRFNENAEADPEMSLAESWERPSRDVVEYTIRDHTWHDGEDVTPEDVAFTFNYIQENEVPLYQPQWEVLDTAEVVDDSTVRVTFKEGQAPGPVHRLFSFQVPILPKHIWESRSNPNNATVKEPVGSGPLQLDYWDEGSELVLESFDEHWQAPNFDRRIIRIIPEQSTIWSLLDQGELNYTPRTSIGKQLSDLEQKDHISVAQTNSSTFWLHTMNLRREGLSERPVRQAAVSAIPKTAIVDQVFYGYPEPGYNIVSPAFERYHNEDVMRFEEGVEPAKQRLRDNGYVFDDNGMVHFPAN